jgi:motility quorum-sensing regulator/GCU-specific mRNA interferase toxin
MKVTDKWIPHYNLEEIKRLVRLGKAAITATARQDALSLGLFDNDVWEIVLSLTTQHFYKSMTSFMDHKSWQDVYHPVTDAGTLYLKLTIRDGVLVLSCKEK